MRVICNGNTGQSLTSRCLNLGNTRESLFPVSVGKEYYVFAISLWQGVIYLLLTDDYHLPYWFPMCLFSVNDPRLPEDWLFSFFDDEGDERGLQALWGYDQLINDATHYEALIEREPEALRYFYEEEKRRLGLD